MEKARTAAPGTVFVVMTAFGTISSAVEAMKKAAREPSLSPGFDPPARWGCRRSRDGGRPVFGSGDAAASRAASRSANASGHIVCADPKMQGGARVGCAQVGPSKASVFLTGESGTGKELVAEAIHLASPRSRAPFVRLHCAALSESLLESELFGHERGSASSREPMARREGRSSAGPTAARCSSTRDRRRSPRGGAGQAAALPPGEDVARCRVGGNETLKVDVRVLAATNRDLLAEVEAASAVPGRTLFYRLNDRDGGAAAASPSGAGRRPGARELLPPAATPPRTGRPSRPSPTTRSSRCWTTAGRATCASWST